MHVCNGAHVNVSADLSAVGCASQPPVQEGGNWTCTTPLQPGQICSGFCNQGGNYAGTLGATCGSDRVWYVTSSCFYRK
jgi:hypothetical protein